MADGSNQILDDAKKETDSEKNKVDSALEGAGAIQDLAGGIEKLVQGDWTEGLLSLGSAGVDVGMIAAGGNPFESLLSWGFGWVIEHVDFLKDPLDYVTGDQDALDLEAQKWTAISKEVQKMAEELTDEVRKNCMSWEGPAADAYRQYVQEQLDSYRALSDAAASAGSVVEICKMILDVVRTLIRDLITDTLAKIIFILLRYPPPGYPGALAGEGVPFAVRQATKAMGQVKRLMKAFSNAKQILGQLGELLQGLAKNFGKYAKAAGKAIGGYAANVGKDLGHVAKDVLPGLGGAVVKESVKGLLDLGVSSENNESDLDKRRDRTNTTIDPKDAGVVGKRADTGDPAGREAKVEPVFDRPGGRRISGSL
ncbi:WXG100 family type VII secretion target [Amycolatopsis sp. lyj-112]|uniref:WXG100 family type VII secretion target n=1 Tax=Amycolatopsis sp. lyj-112 TaxID=2789288 RepID=UPI00397DF2B2